MRVPLQNNEEPLNRFLVDFTSMGDDTVTTEVDDLLAYLKGKERVALQDAATVLNVTPETIQAWVDFLVEEKILGIEYKFTKPFIYLNKEEKKKGKIIEDTSVTIDQVKQEYFDDLAFFLLFFDPGLS